MTKKRRVFDIDFDAPLDDVPAGTDAPEARRGPMAAAITENAEALASRQQAEAAIREENDRLAHQFVELKKQGLIVDLVPIDQIRTDKLIRDRAPKRDHEIDELKDSIKSVGLSNPIRVEEHEEGWELVQGWRRLTAYRELYKETGNPAYARIPAGLVARGAKLDELYIRMVDENLIRRDISFAEMAQLAVAYAREPETTVAGPLDAVDRLYASAGRQKRAYIKHFTTLMRAIGPALKHAEAIPRRLGLELVKRLEENPDLAVDIQHVLLNTQRPDVETELAVLLPSDQAKATADTSSLPIDVQIATADHGIGAVVNPLDDPFCMAKLHRRIKQFREVKRAIARAIKGHTPTQIARLNPGIQRPAARCLLPWQNGNVGQGCIDPPTAVTLA